MNDSSLISSSTKRLKVAKYLRVSTDEQEDKYGFPIQKEKIDKLISLRDQDFEFVSEDYHYQEQITGSSEIEARDELKRLFADLEYAKEHGYPNPFDMVVVYKIDRFARSLKVLLEIVDRLTQYNVWFVSCLESIDTSTPFGRAMLWIMWVFAELEKEMNTEKMQSGRIKMLEDGKKLQDKYGYKRNDVNEFEVYEPEAVIVRQIFDLYVNLDLSIADIVRKLTWDKVLIPRASKEKKRPGKQYKNTYISPHTRNDATIRNILADEEYLGVSFYQKSKSSLDIKTWKVWYYEKFDKKDWKRAEASFEAIINEEIYTSAQARLKKTKWKYIVAEEGKYLLTWLLYCDACKNKTIKTDMRQWRWDSGNQVACYKCQGKDAKQKHKELRCTCIPISKLLLEQEVTNQVLSFIKNPRVFYDYLQNSQGLQARKTSTMNRIETLKQELDQINIALKNQYSMCMNGSIWDKQYQKNKQELENKKREIQKSIGTHQKTYNALQDEDRYILSIESLWDLIHKTVEEAKQDTLAMKKLIKLFVSKVIIISKPKPDDFVLPWRGKEGQMLPSKLRIEFNLPQQIVKSYFSLTRQTWSFQEDYRRFTGSDGRYITIPKNEVLEKHFKDVNKLEEWMPIINQLQLNLRKREKLSEEKRLEKLEQWKKKHPDVYEYLVLEKI